jgi:hypothetical protein
LIICEVSFQPSAISKSKKLIADRLHKGSILLQADLSAQSATSVQSANLASNHATYGGD